MRSYYALLLVLCASALVVTASAAVNCTQLEQNCWTTCNAIKKDAVDKNCANGGYSGCALDIFTCGGATCGTYNQYWCDMPGYVGCLDPLVATDQSCLVNCNVKFRARTSFGEGLTILNTCGTSDCNLNPEGCSCTFEAGVLNCKNQSCYAYCTSIAGASGGNWVRYSAKLRRWDACECYDVMTDAECTAYCLEYHGTDKIHGPEASGKMVNGVCSCSCREGYAPDQTLTCVKVQAEGTYAIEPRPVVVTGGQQAKVTVVETKPDGTKVVVGNEKVAWSLVNHVSVNEYETKGTPVADIGPDGTITGKKIGTFTVVAKITDKNLLLKADGRVVCRQDMKGNLLQVRSLYEQRIPRGQLWNDLESLTHASGTSFLSNYYGNYLKNILDHPPAAGYYTNVLSFSGHSQYTPYVCGEYQAKVLKLLNTMQADPNECSFLNGYDFAPISGWGGVHVAVVIWEEGSSWDTSGTVLDPWPSQEPRSYDINQWKFVWKSAGAKYTVLQPPSVAPPQIVLKRNKITGMVRCPVALRITDTSGRRLGVLDDGSIVQEIPDSSIANIPDTEGSNNWFFLLTSDSLPSYTMEMTGTGDGQFELLWVDSEHNELLYYEPQTITRGAKSRITLDFTHPSPALLLPNGTQVPPRFLNESGTAAGFSGLVFESRARPTGTEVQIPLTLSGVKETIGNIDLTLTYNPKVLQASQVLRGSLTDDTLFDSNILPGTIRIGIASKMGITGDGSVAHLTFNVIGTEGSTSPLTITTFAANRAEDLATLTIPTQNGVFTVISTTEARGDGSGDREVTALDALMALQMAVGKRAEDLTLDMDSNGKVTSLDARMILKQAVE